MVSIRDYEYFGEEGIDQRWNSNGGTLNGEEFNMRRNFYNKPLATFNWDWQMAENLALNTSVYGSAGRGGGTGPRGRNYDVLPYQLNLYDFLSVEDTAGNVIGVEPGEYRNILTSAMTQSWMTTKAERCHAMALSTTSKAR